MPPVDTEVAALEQEPHVGYVTFETVDHQALAREQAQCPEVVTH